MHRLNLHYLASEQARNALMPETNTQHRHIGIQNDLARYAEIPFAIRPSRSRRDDYAAEVKTANLIPAHFVVSNDNRHLAGNRRNRMDQVEGE